MDLGMSLNCPLNMSVTCMRKISREAWGNGSPMSRLSIKRHLLLAELVIGGRPYPEAGRRALVGERYDRVQKMFKSSLHLVRRAVGGNFPVSGRVDLVRKNRAVWLERVKEARRVLL